MGEGRCGNGPRAPLDDASLRVSTPLLVSNRLAVRSLVPEAQEYRIEDLRTGQSEERGEAMPLAELSMKESTMMSGLKPLIVQECYT